MSVPRVLSFQTVSGKRQKQHEIMSYSSSSAYRLFYFHFLQLIMGFLKFIAVLPLPCFISIWYDHRIRQGKRYKKKRKRIVFIVISFIIKQHLQYKTAAQFARCWQMFNIMPVSHRLTLLAHNKRKTARR